MACACRTSLLRRFLSAPFAARTTFETKYRPIGRAARGFASDSSPSDGPQPSPAQQPEQTSSPTPTTTTTNAPPASSPASAAAPTATATEAPATDEPLPSNVTFTPAPESPDPSPSPSPKPTRKLRLRLAKQHAKHQPPTTDQDPPRRRAETWQTQKDALQAKFPLGWAPAKRLSPDALAGIRALHAQFPETYTTPALASLFAVSPEAVRRILKSKWTASPEEEERRRERWVRRGTRVWERWAGMGVKVPHKWRAEGVGVRPAAGARWGHDRGEQRGDEGWRQGEPETPEEAKAREAKEKGENALERVRARRKLAGKIM